MINISIKIIKKFKIFTVLKDKVETLAQDLILMLADNFKALTMQRAYDYPTCHGREVPQMLLQGVQHKLM